VSVSCRLEVKAVPNASRDEVAGWIGDKLKVKVRAPALEGRANGALCEFLAGALGIPSRSVSLVHGEKARHKLVRIDGLGLEEVRTRLEKSDRTS
jgi:uncharacterized protein (TIGR00251 family)